ncbi:tetratricopeptide repeat protein [Cryptosporangium japonicum]|uniref:FxSxx-COOH system tetratricopeptide repeat protein n=1 Tax=Cryptosporangium japonicum TaxID=80872 RepID=A0ABP3EEG1_9ACTN
MPDSARPDSDGRKNFFISYTAADRQWAEWIAWQLEGANYSVVIQAWDFRPSENFVSRMNEALEIADCTLAVVSPAYVASKYCTKEWTGAFIRATEGDGRLLLVQVEKCSMPALLEGEIRIGLTGLDDPAEARKTLLQGLTTGRVKPDEEPRFPRERLGAAPFPGTPTTLAGPIAGRDPHFTGRLDALAAIHSTLRGIDEPMVIQAVHGLGGIGKTHLATEYCYRFRMDYRMVWWVPAERPELITAELDAMARRLKLPDLPVADDPNDHLVQRRNQVYDRLDQYGDWLIVLDNAPDPQAVRDYLPRERRGRALITSRHTAWSGLARPLGLDVMHRPESVLLLQKRLPELTIEDADQLAHLLGDLPLALDQAASYLEFAKVDLATYRTLFESARSRLFSDKTARPTHYRLSIETTWRMAIETIGSPAASYLLYLIALLNPDQIPRAALQRVADHLPESLGAAFAGTADYVEATAQLLGFSLIKGNSSHLSIHRLMQFVVRDHLEEVDPEAARALHNGLVSWLAAEVRSSSDRQHDELMPHVQAVLDRATPEIDAAPVVRLCEFAGTYLHHRLRLADAHDLIRRAITLSVGADLNDDLPLWQIKAEYAAILQEQGRNADARVEYATAFVTAETMYGPDDMRVAVLVSQIGRLLQVDGDLDGAYDRLTRADAVAAASGNASDPRRARIVSNLGRVLQDRGRMFEARDAYQRALDLAIAAYGADDPHPAMYRNDLAGALQYIGDVRRARRELKRCLTTLDAHYGPDSTRTVAPRANLGGVLHDSGDLVGARTAFETALDILHRNPRGNTTRIADLSAALGVVLRDLGEHDEAVRLLTYALEQEESAYGPGHPRTATIRVHFGVGLLGQDPARAHALLKQALTTTANTYGTHHPRVAAIRTNLGIAQQDIGELAAAKESHLRAFLDTETAYGHKHRRIAAICANLARVLVVEEPPAALRQLERAAATARKAVPPRHWRLPVFDRSVQELRQRIEDGTAAGLELPFVPITLRTYQQSAVIDL